MIAALNFVYREFELSIASAKSDRENNFTIENKVCLKFVYRERQI